MFRVNKNILIVLAIVLILAVIIIANFVFNKDIDLKTGDQSNQTSSQNNNSSSNVSENITQDNNQTGVAQEYPEYSGRPINEVRFGVGFSAPENVIVQKTKDLNDLKTALEKDPFNINDWIAVGITKKFFNDYEGTKDAWEYATVLYPNDPLAFENLGNLYALYIHDNQKAEYYYKNAIENNPIEPSFYIALSDFYKNFLNDNSKAINIILSGVYIVEDINLFIKLASLYKDIGDKTNAIKYYQEVLKISPNHPGIQEEIDRLK